MTKFLGIDLGQSKCGLALADSETKIAVPFGVVKLKDLRLKINDLIKNEGVEKIIIGLPLSLNGQETKQTKTVSRFIQDLRHKIKAEIITEDERLTSAQAKSANSTHSRKGTDDAVAAMYILQMYLDKINL